jgi:hypothetical protein
MGERNVRGWAFVYGSRKAHWFECGESLCLRWKHRQLDGFMEDESAEGLQCAECRRKLRALKG